MSNPTVTLELDLRRVIEIHPDDPTFHVNWPDAIYVVTRNADGETSVSAVVVQGDVEITVVKP